MTTGSVFPRGPTLLGLNPHIKTTLVSISPPTRKDHRGGTSPFYAPLRTLHVHLAEYLIIVRVRLYAKANKNERVALRATRRPCPAKPRPPFYPRHTMTNRTLNNRTFAEGVIRRPILLPPKKGGPTVWLLEIHPKPYSPTLKRLFPPQHKVKVKRGTPLVVVPSVNSLKFQSC